ncbi:MAG: hypothetical protein LH628_27810 [Microcoleus sp. CAN_BIN18]|nr:hypothetical protein [Microcoleus sp. CAN_BIN18]
MPIANFILTQAFTAIFAVKTDIIGDRATSIFVGKRHCRLLYIRKDTAMPCPY